MLKQNLFKIKPKFMLFRAQIQKAKYHYYNVYPFYDAQALHKQCIFTNILYKKYN